jgi:hypothetical protein
MKLFPCPVYENYKEGGALPQAELYQKNDFEKTVYKGLLQ